MIRRARPDEAGTLSRLALASKGYWGYDEAFLARAAPELTISAEQIDAERFFVLEQDGRIAGFYGLTGRPPALVLDFLFVAPDRIGSGLGRRLWAHALDTARHAGAAHVHLEAEPNAEGFYRSRGAVRVGEVTSSMGRALPLMRVALA